MKYINLIFLSIFLLISTSFAARQKVDLNIKNLSIEEFLKVVSKIYDKNILITQPITGNIDFVGDAPIYKDELADILLTTLETKGFTLVGSGSFLKVVRASVAAKENLPIVKSLGEKKFMVTKAITLETQNIDVVVQKIRHLLSPSARLVTMRETNTMLISEYPSNIQTVIDAINLLVKDKSKDVEFVPVKNASADGVFTQILAIVKAKDNQNVATNQFAVLKNSNDNSIIVVGTKKQRDFVKKLVKDLDKKENLSSPQTKIISLTHTDSKTLAKTVTDLLGKSVDKTKVTPLISADEEMNSLIVIAMIEDIKKIQTLVKELDVARQQVYVKATIVELNDDATRKLGVDYGVSLLGGDAGAGIYGIGVSLAKKGNAKSDLMLLEAIKQDAKASFAVDIGVDFLRSKGVAKTLSEPSIICVNNKQSDIYVGKTMSFQIASNTQTTGGTVNSYTRQDVGLTLSVKPRISSKDLVALEVSAQLENVAGVSGDGQPITTKSRVKTNAIVKNGEPVVLGGLTREDESTKEDGIYLLSEIPFLGNLFKKEEKLKQKQNLLVIITPYIINSDQDLQALREKLLEQEQLKNSFLKNIALD